MDAPTPGAVDELVLGLAHAQAGCTRALLLPQRASPLDEATRHHLELAARLADQGDMVVSDDRRCVAIRYDGVIASALVVEFDEAQTDAALQDSLVPGVLLADRHLHQVRALAQLSESHAQLERSENLQRALFAISELADSGLAMPEMLRGIHDIVRTLMYAENFYIIRHDPERAMLHVLYYADTMDEHGPSVGAQTPLEEWRGSLTWHVITRGQPLMGSADELSAQIKAPLTVVGPASEDWLGVPMVREGVVEGALVVQSYQRGMRFTAEDRALLGFVGSHILTTLERRRSKSELEQRVDERTRELARVNRGLQQEVQERQRAVRLQEALFRLAQLATADIDERSFHERVHAVVRQLLNADNFYIALLSDDRQSLDFPYYVDQGVVHRLSRPLGHGMSEYVLRSGKAWLGSNADIEALRRRGEVQPRNIGEPATCWLGVPLRVNEEVIGLVAVQSYDKGIGYDQADKELLGFAALQIASSISRRRSAAALQEANVMLEHRVDERTRELRAEIARREQAQQQLRHQVMHDPLTGLPNRGYLRERLEHLLGVLKSEPGHACALLYIDVDRFKMINDSLGHLAGDAFLKAVAKRLKHCVRGADVVARLSGDEFVILMEDIDHRADAEELAQRVMQVMTAPMQIAGRETLPSISMGIAIGDHQYGRADDLVRDADIALYRAKELGRRRYVLFDETLAKNVLDVFTLENELRHGLERDEFEPYFQPICQLADGLAVGYEALLRWRHPRRGLLAPDDFQRVAQDTGHLESIDWRLFKRACQSFRTRAAGGLFLAINVSPLHLRDTDFDRRLLGMLERVGFPRERLVLEITEGALLHDAGTVRATLARLHDVGVAASLDDFGTGYSSLSHLHALPLRKLKIDQSFVQALGEPDAGNSRVVVASILALGRALDIDVIAEGIESEAQRQMLLEMGCQLGQGFLLGRPQAAG